jgi:hypothetical protein
VFVPLLIVVFFVGLAALISDRVRSIMDMWIAIGITNWLRVLHHIYWCFEILWFS